MGFEKKPSTNQAILEVMKAIDENKFTLGVFLFSMTYCYPNYITMESEDATFITDLMLTLMAMDLTRNRSYVGCPRARS